MKRLIGILFAVLLLSGCASVQTADDKETLPMGSYYLDGTLIRPDASWNPEDIAEGLGTAERSDTEYTDSYYDDSEYGDNEYGDDEYDNLKEMMDSLPPLGATNVSVDVKDYDEEDGSVILFDFIVSDTACQDARICVYVDGELLTSLCPSDPGCPGGGVRLKQISEEAYESRIVVPWDGRLRGGNSITPGEHSVSLAISDMAGNEFQESYELYIDEGFEPPDIYFDPFMDGLFIFEILLYVL